MPNLDVSIIRPFSLAIDIVTTMPTPFVGFFTADFL